MLVLLIVSYIGAMAQEPPGSAATAYHVFGHCHDYGTALGLKASVFAVFKQGRQKLAVCKETGDFDVLLPVSATHLALEMNGYRSVSIPVYFTPDIPADARFGIGNWAAMARLDSLPIPAGQGGSIALYFTVTDSLDIKYTLTSLTNAAKKLIAPISYPRLKNRSFTFPITPDDYLATVSMATTPKFQTDGTLRSSEKITLKPGVTFKSVRIAKPTGSTLPGSATPNSTPIELPLSIYILYFDQSSPNLRPGVKATLDSLAEKLVKQPTLLATVTGYTDNVGKRELNLVLAEYRAKAVASYLRQRGVLADQIVAKWEGPDKKASAEDPEAVKTISRRVVVLLAPR
ncbi:OmpA family protein [Spirosoma telluris]